MSSACDALRANIKVGLARLDISQSELARRAGLTPAYVSQLISGKNASPGLNQIEAIAKAIGTTPARLLAGPEDQPDLKSSVHAALGLLQDLDRLDDESVRTIVDMLRKR